MSEKVFCCESVIESNFCPHCGGTYENAVKKGESPYPYRFTTALHGSSEDSKKDEAIEDLGFDIDDDYKNKVVQNIMRCDYEITFLWEVTEDGKVTLIEVNGKPFKENENG